MCRDYTLGPPRGGDDIVRYFGKPETGTKTLPAPRNSAGVTASKEAANVLKELLDKKAYRAKLAERLFVGPKWVPLNAEIKSGYRPISVFTAQGPRTSLKTFEYAEHVKMTFRVRVLRDSVLKEGDLRTLVEYMAENGVGSDRSQGAGQVLEWSFERVS